MSWRRRTGMEVYLFSFLTLEIEQKQVNGTYVYRHKHNYIPYSTFAITKVQLHVSAIHVGHLQVVHEELINNYTKECGEFTGCGVGWVRVWCVLGN